MKNKNEIYVEITSPEEAYFLKEKLESVDEKISTEFYYEHETVGFQPYLIYTDAGEWLCYPSKGDKEKFTKEEFIEQFCQLIFLAKKKNVSLSVISM